MIVSEGECVARYQDRATARDGSVRSRAVSDTRDTLIYRLPNCRAARIWRVSDPKFDVEIRQHPRLHFWGSKVAVTCEKYRELARGTGRLPELPGTGSPGSVRPRISGGQAIQARGLPDNTNTGRSASSADRSTQHGRLAHAIFRVNTQRRCPREDAPHEW